MNIRLIVILCLLTNSPLAYSKNKVPEIDVYTLYSTNSPTEFGRSGIATYDLAREPLNGAMCQESANLHQADFERRKKLNKWNYKMRFWCEKGRFKE